MCEMDYSYILTYAPADNREELIAEAEKVSEEEVCIVSFMEMDANDALIKLLDQTFAD